MTLFDFLIDGVLTPHPARGAMTSPRPNAAERRPPNDQIPRRNGLSSGNAARQWPSPQSNAAARLPPAQCCCAKAFPRPNADARRPPHGPKLPHEGLPPDPKLPHEGLPPSQCCRTEASPRPILPRRSSLSQCFCAMPSPRPNAAERRPPPGQMPPRDGLPSGNAAGQWPFPRPNVAARLPPAQ